MNPTYKHYYLSFLLLAFSMVLRAGEERRPVEWMPPEAQVIPRLPRAANLLSFLHGPMRRYMARLQEEVNFTDNKNGCLNYLDLYRFCVRSQWIQEGKRKIDSVVLFYDNRVIQEFHHTQSGSGLTLSTVDDLREFRFRTQGIKGAYQAKGLTNITYTWNKEFDENSGERSILVFDPVNFFLEILYMKTPEMSRLRYDVRCDFCSGDWIEVQEIGRAGLPPAVFYYSSSQTRDITPRLFDSLLNGAYFQPLAQLGATIQRTLVGQAGGYPSLQF